MKNKHKVKILIPNATSPKNVGDLAMLTVLIRILKSAYKNPKIVIHSVDPLMIDRKMASRIDETIYSHTVFKSRNLLVRLKRVCELLIKYLLYKINLNILPKNKLDELILDYKNSDLIIFVGNGNIRAKKGLTQSLNLLMLLMLFQISKLFPAKKIVSPISFGPFGYKWQETLALRAIDNLDLIAAREEFSFNVLKKNKVKNLIISSDHALLSKIKVKKFRKAHPVVGFTIRNWLPKNEQLNFESDIILGLEKFTKLQKGAIQPIVQVNAPEYGEKDEEAVNRVIHGLKSKKVSVLKIKKAKDLKSALKIYSGIDLLLGMRMHSNILAATQGTPFVSISYEYKSMGISKQLKMDEYCVNCNDLDVNLIVQKLNKIYKQKNQLQKRFLKVISEIQTNELPRWTNLVKVI